jgi:hypothetical protein
MADDDADSDVDFDPFTPNDDFKTGDEYHEYSGSEDNSRGNDEDTGSEDELDAMLDALMKKETQEETHTAKETSGQGGEVKALQGETAVAEEVELPGSTATKLVGKGTGKQVRMGSLEEQGNKEGEKCSLSKENIAVAETDLLTDWANWKKEGEERAKKEGEEMTKMEAEERAQTGQKEAEERTMKEAESSPIVCSSVEDAIKHIEGGAVSLE